MIKNISKITKEKNLKFNSDIYGMEIPHTKLWGILAISMGGIGILTAIIFDFFIAVCVCVGTIVVILGVMLLIMPLFLKKNANKVFAQNAKNLDSMIFKYVFDDDALEISNGDDVVLAQGGYENLTTIVETDEAFYLMTEPYFGFVVDKDGFEQGDQDQLKTLLQEKVGKYVRLPSATK